MDDAIRALGCRRAAAQYSRMCAIKSSGYLLLSPPASPDGPGRSRWRLCGTLRRQGLFDHTAQHVQVNHKGSHETIVDLALAIIRPPKLCDGARYGFRVSQGRSADRALGAHVLGRDCLLQKPTTVRVVIESRSEEAGHGDHREEDLTNPQSSCAVNVSWGECVSRNT